MESATRVHITRKSLYFTRKSVESIIAANNAERHGLKRTLGWASLLALGIGGIIGAGIFVLTGTVAANVAGPGVMVSFLLSGIACAFVALCYAELASLIPVSGSTYTYTYATLGEIFAWIIGWDLVLEYGAGAATVAVGWSGYFNKVLQGFGVNLPPELTHALFAGTAHAGETAPHGFFNLPAAGVILMLTALLARGTQESAAFNNVIVVIKVAVVLAVIIFGAPYVEPSNWTPLTPENSGEAARMSSQISTGISAGSAITAGPARCVARRWSSSPISVSTAYRPPRRKPGCPSATCPSAFWVR